MKPKSVISWLVIFTLAIGVPRGVTAAGDSLKKPTRPARHAWGDFSFANAVNGNGLIVGYSTTANGWEHAFAWTAADGMIDLGTLGGPRSFANFVNDAGMIVGTSHAPGHQGLHAFVWTAAAGMVEMPSLGRLDSVWAMSANGSFAGFSSGKKSVEDQHAVLWTPATASASLTQADAKSPVTSTVALEVPVGDAR